MKAYLRQLGVLEPLKDQAILIIDTYDHRYYRDAPIPHEVRNLNVWAGLEAYGFSLANLRRI